MDFFEETLSLCANAGPPRPTLATAPLPVGPHPILTCPLPSRFQFCRNISNMRHAASHPGRRCQAAVFKHSLRLQFAAAEPTRS